MLNNKALPFVTNAKHLGNILDVTNNNKDISVKRGITIGKINGVLQEFNFAHPRTKCAVMQKYCTSFYGCELWDLYSNEFNSLLTAWNISIRKAWDVPNKTHRRFIEPLSGYAHIKNMIFKRFLHFFNQCMSHKENTMLNHVARIVCFNVDTTTGANLRKIWLETGVSPYQSSCKKVGDNLFYHSIHN